MGTHQAATSGLRRDARVIGLLFASTTSMIGSGWLFGAFHASRIAGPLSLWSWVVGAVIVMLIALCFAELAALFPRSGALVHMSHATHGDALGRLWGWMLFLAYVAVPAVEAEAVVTYANNYLPYFLQPHSAGMLSVPGFIACSVLLGVFALLNLMAVRKLLGVNSVITWWKIAVPLVTALALVAVGAHIHWPAGESVWNANRSGYSFDGIFLALPAAGIVFSYLGFRTAIDLGGESENPGRNIPLAVIGSVLLSAAVYILLQLGYLSALRPSDIAHGWSSVAFSGDAGPFAALAASLGMGWLATVLYVDAYISPGGTGLMYVTGGSRILFAVGELGAGPRWLTRLNDSQVPLLSVLVMWVVGVLFLLPFPAWQKMVNYITSVTVLTYGLGPVVLLILRDRQPELERQFRLPGAGLIAPLAFIASNWIVYWTGYVTNSFLFIVVAVGFAFYAAWYHVVAGKPAAEFGWKHISWLLAWFGGMWVLSAVGDVGGGYGLLGFWPGVVLVAIWSLVVIWLAKHSALPADDIAREMVRIESTL